jgi:SAM-dependent methyltransferase
MERWALTFDRDPAGYAEGRPGYPTQLFDVLEARCGLAPGVDVLEVGPGTGQATKELLARGALVHAVEPGRRLAAHLRRTLGSEALAVSVGRFEDVVLDEASADLVVAATSFHWVDVETCAAKAAATLRPGGWVALWWNVFHDPAGPDAFSRALEPLYAEIGDRESPHGGHKALDEEFWLGLLARVGLDDRTAQRFAWEIEHSTNDVVALYATFSGTRVRPPKERARLLEGVRATADERFGGRVRRRYVTPLYTARKPLSATSARRSARP